jgi:hypothetical protein
MGHSSIADDEDNEDSEAPLFLCQLHESFPAFCGVRC